VVRVIRQQAASLLHMDGSMVFARRCQCIAPPNTCFLGPARVHIPYQTVQPFAQLMAEHPYTLQWSNLSPVKITASHGVIWTPI